MIIIFHARDFERKTCTYSFEYEKVALFRVDVIDKWHNKIGT